MVPLEWYKDEEHIGYDREGEKLLRKAKQDRLDALLAKNDLGTQWRTIYDEYNDEEIVLSKEEVELIQRVREGRFPDVEVRAKDRLVLTLASILRYSLAERNQTAWHQAALQSCACALSRFLCRCGLHRYHNFMYLYKLLSFCMPAWGLRMQVNPYEPEADWFTREREIHPLSSAPEPKRRFIPSKWEEKKYVSITARHSTVALQSEGHSTVCTWQCHEVHFAPSQSKSDVRGLQVEQCARSQRTTDCMDVTYNRRVVKLVRALRKGWIKREKEEVKEPEAYLLWQDDGLVSDKTATGAHCSLHEIALLALIRHNRPL